MSNCFKTFISQICFHCLLYDCHFKVQLHYKIEERVLKFNSLPSLMRIWMLGLAIKSWVTSHKPLFHCWHASSELGQGTTLGSHWLSDSVNVHCLDKDALTTLVVDEKWAFWVSSAFCYRQDFAIKRIWISFFWK
jgi:hypothetical protein